MSQNLLNKTKSHPIVKRPLKERDWRAVILFPAWVLLAFYASQFIVAGSLWALRTSGFDLSRLGSLAVLQAAISAIIYACAIAITIGVPYIFSRRTDLKTIGLQRLMSWLDIGLAPFAYIAYIAGLFIVLAAVTHVIPGFQADQAQDVGFKNLTNQLGYIVAFTTLVVIAPIAEEILFRGYLYGKVRRHAPIWVAIIVTSLLFGFVHGQWNVAVDTFILSCVLCGLRELTGSVWAGILVHMIKNAIAFYILFLAPLVGPGIGS